MENLFIKNLNTKDVEHFTSDLGLFLRKNLDRPFKKMCNIFTNSNIISNGDFSNLTDEQYFYNLSTEKISLEKYNLKKFKNNIILERYPKLNRNESYIFVCNHTCPEDIETVLNVLDRNAYLILGSIESLKYNPEMYLTWLNGMIPFDILNEQERKKLLLKMERVIKTNSILIFPEGSHNYHPNKIINNLFDGPVNLALNSGKKIVITTLIRDAGNNVSYIDVSNPINVADIPTDYLINKETEKEKIKAISTYIRDKMATAVYYILERHFDVIKRKEYLDIEEHFKNKYIQDAFAKLKWNHDVFEAEYLVKKTTKEIEYEEVIKTLGALRSNLEKKKVKIIEKEYQEVMDLIGNTTNSQEYENTIDFQSIFQLRNKSRNMDQDYNDWLLKNIDIQNKDVANYMRNYWAQCQSHDSKKLIKKKSSRIV